MANPFHVAFKTSAAPWQRQTAAAVALMVAQALRRL